MPLELDVLPADALRAVFACLPDAASRAACRAVCRRWRQAADDGAEVWGAAALRRPRMGGAGPARPPAPLAAACALLRRQRAHLRRLHLEEGALQGRGAGADELAAALQAACSPGSGLTDVTIVDPCPAVTQALPGGAGQLTALTLRALPGGAASWPFSWGQLAHLSQLSSLAILSVVRREACPQALRCLTGLTRLRLACAPGCPLDLASVLLACPDTLLRLELVGGSIGQAPLQKWPAATPAATATQTPTFPPGIAAAGDGASGSGEGSVEHNHAPLPAPAAQDPHAAAHSGALLRGPALAAALAERWELLEALRLQQVHVAHEAVMQVLPTLRCLTSLHLAPRDCDSACVEVAQRCKGLQELVLGRYAEERLPEVPAGALRQLARLRISGSGTLRALPDSWCALPSLQSFELESCERLRWLPAAMAGMTQLERLLFSHQRMERVPAQLTGLSQLTRLAVAACSLQDLPPGPYLAHLRELVLFANNISCVPPALADAACGAPRLTRLDLSGNYSHNLCAGDVEVLRRLPALEALDLRRQEYTPADRHSPALLAQLRDVLPRCDVLA